MRTPLKNRVALGVVLAALVFAATHSIRAELPQAIGTWASLGTTPESRVGAAAVALQDGRTIIAGGSVDGTPTDSVVVFDPNTGSFSLAGHLLLARVGHTATLLDDGRILIAGGTAGDLISADLELFDPAAGVSVLGGAMTQPRSGHAAAKLADGKVLIVGGTGIDGVLQSAELYDPETGAVSLTTLPMLSPRTGASATTLIDGRVLVAGGNNGTTDLASAEMFDPWSQIFEATTTVLSFARSGHAAVLLPNNNSVLIAGGSSNDVPVQTSDLFVPAEFPDPYSYGMGSFAQTGDLLTARARAIASPHIEGYAVAMGGGAPEAEVYRFATVKTDKDDYAPGERAVITGSGWEPDSEVTLLFQEDPAVHDDYVLHVPTDGNGNIYWDQWAPEQHDLNVRFYLLAKQSTQQGERRAQMTFTDSTTVVINSVVGFPKTVSANGSGDATLNVGYNFALSFAQSTTSAHYDVYLKNGGTTVPLASSAACPAGVVAGTYSGSPSVTLSGATSATKTWDLHVDTTRCNGQGTQDSKTSSGWVVVNPPPALSINDVTQAEGNAGTTTFTFTVTMGSTSTLTTTVDYATAASVTNPATGGVACGAGIDYSSKTGTLSFAPGDTSKNITVNVCGDTTYESDETFLVNLSNATNATISDNQGLGTITNDDTAPTLTINDVTQVEGDGPGTTTFTFTVTKSGTTDVASSVSYATANGSGNVANGAANCSNPNTDYITTSGTLNFAAGDTTKTIDVSVCGETKYENTDNFVVNLTSPSGATISDSQGVGTITNDDNVPTLAINDVTQAEGNAGTSTFTFTVTKTGTTDLDATVDYATAVGGAHPATDGTCGVAGIDYEAASGMLTFQPNQSSRTFTVTVCGDATYELDETFLVSLSNVTTATISDSQGQGTIQNDDIELKIVKVLDPAGDGGRFDLMIDATTFDNGGLGYGHNGNTGFQTVTFASHTVAEVAHTGTTLSNYVSSISCDNGASGSDTSLTVDLTNAAPAQVTCTITNKRKPQLKIVKVLDPAGDGGKFDLMIDATTFNNGGAGYGHNGNTGFQTVSFASHTVAELAHTGTTLDNYTSSISCDNGSSGDGTSLVVNLTLAPAGAQVTCTITNTLKNTPPLVTADDADFNEGTSTLYSATWTDQDVGQTHTCTIDFGDGNGPQAATMSPSQPSSSGTCSASHTYEDGPNLFTITVKVNDGFADGSDTASATVTNVAPTVDFTGGDALVDESGVTEHTYTYSITDPGVDTVSSVSTSCGIGGTKVFGSDANTDTSGSFKCVFPDGPASPSVTASATDSDDATGSTATRVVTVNNVAPTVAFTGGDTTVDESGVTQHTYAYSITDPGVDTVSSVSTSCGTGGTKLFGSDANTDTSGSFKCVFPDGPASPSVTASATDSDGDAGSTATRVVTVNNVAPTVAFTGGDTTVDESGVTQHTYAYSITDPGADTVSSVSTSCGTGGTKVIGSDANTDTSGSFKCVFPDGPASPSVTATATDSDGDAGNTATRAVTVNNVKPVIGTTITATGNSGTACLAGNSVGLSFTFTDPAGTYDTYTGQIAWGDSNMTSFFSSPVNSSHLYAAGSYTIAIDVNDEDPGLGDHRTVPVSLMYATSGILQPINTDGSSRFKLGSTIPVKVRVTDCNGNPVGSLGPKIALQLITGATGVVNEVISSSAADTGNTMRYDASGMQYIFNLSTKRSQFNAGNDLTEGRYRLTISDPTFPDVVVDFEIRR